MSVYLQIYEYYGEVTATRNTNTKLNNVTLYFNTVPMFFNALGPLLHELHYTHRNERSWLSRDPRMRPFFHFLVRGKSTVP
jgi:hypothetical protein